MVELVKTTDCVSSAGRNAVFFYVWTHVKMHKSGGVNLCNIAIGF
jgi:hypothetical protein